MNINKYVSLGKYLHRVPEVLLNICSYVLRIYVCTAMICLIYPHLPLSTAHPQTCVHIIIRLIPPGHVYYVASYMIHVRM